MKIIYYEQIEEVASLLNKEAMVNRLRQYGSPRFKELMNYIFHPDIVWLIPNTEIKYVPMKDGGKSMAVRMQQEVRKIPNLLNVGPYPNLDPVKRMFVFKNILETVHPSDALLLLAAKDKKLPFEKVTKEIVAEAFPDISYDWFTKNDDVNILTEIGKALVPDFTPVITPEEHKMIEEVIPEKRKRGRPKKVQS